MLFQQLIHNYNFNQLFFQIMVNYFYHMEFYHLLLHRSIYFKYRIELRKYHKIKINGKLMDEGQ